MKKPEKAQSILTLSPLKALQENDNEATLIRSAAVSTAMSLLDDSSDTDLPEISVKKKGSANSTLAFALLLLLLDKKG